MNRFPAWPQFEPRAGDGSAAPRVLVVDDNEGMLDTLSDVLASCGFAVETAISGDDAVESMGMRGRLDIVVMDIRMPGALDGVAAMHRIRAIAPHVPVVLMTAFANDALVREAEGIAAAIVKKPIDLPLMLEICRALAERLTG